MIPDLDTLRSMTPTNVAGSQSRKGQERKMAQGSVQLIGKAHFGQGNPRKCKPFSLIVFARAWPDFAGFG
jgi:hypothetical protein